MTNEKALQLCGKLLEDLNRIIIVRGNDLPNMYDKTKPDYRKFDIICGSYRECVKDVDNDFMKQHWEAFETIREKIAALQMEFDSFYSMYFEVEKMSDRISLYSQDVRDCWSAFVDAGKDADKARLNDALIRHGYVSDCFVAVEDKARLNDALIRHGYANWDEEHAQLRDKRDKILCAIHHREDFEREKKADSGYRYNPPIDGYVPPTPDDFAWARLTDKDWEIFTKANNLLEDMERAAPDTRKEPEVKALQSPKPASEIVHDVATMVEGAIPAQETETVEKPETAPKVKEVCFTGLQFGLLLGGSALIGAGLGLLVGCKFGGIGKPVGPIKTLKK